MEKELSVRDTYGLAFIIETLLEKKWKAESVWHRPVYCSVHYPGYSCIFLMFCGKLKEKKHDLICTFLNGYSEHLFKVYLLYVLLYILTFLYFQMSVHDLKIFQNQCETCVQHSSTLCCHCVDHKLLEWRWQHTSQHRNERNSLLPS